ncbi:MAG TPA: tRNA epoxyqueuosine(34) reductase QueG, partial [Rhizomicrobium sp.]|nr:tRNA epoxyqueuosine(34) reductase QueG [Rhizomicrobium sp.]
TAQAAENLARYLGEQRHGDMDWMAKNALRRADPQVLWPEAKTIVVLGVNYGPRNGYHDHSVGADRATISVYAQGDDYHDVMKAKLKRFGALLAKDYGAEVKVFVDTAPVMEKPLAEAAGAGWQGKHTNLVSRLYGSWLFLGAVFTTLEIAPDEPEQDHCGQCRRCLDACPTAAFTAPYEIDARRCISYLTIEHKGHVADEFRVAMGNRIYGCDDCLAVCPWNKFASLSREAQFHARAELAQPRLADLARLDDAEFRALFRGSPIKRIGRDRFVRNVLIAIGNSGDEDLAAEAERLLDDASPLVRAMAVWALGRLLAKDRLQSLRRDEPDAAVQHEWDEAISRAATR